MTKRFLSYLIALSFLFSLAGSVQAQPSPVGDRIALLAVELRSEGDLALFESYGLPVFERVQGRQLADYLLTGADVNGQALLRREGLTYSVLDADMHGASYYFAYILPGKRMAQVEWGDFGQHLLDDGVQVLLRTSPERVERLAGVGIKIRRLTLDPKPLRPVSSPLSIPESLDPDPLIQTMINQVNSDTVYNYTGGMSGEWPVWVGDDWFTIASRYTYSGQYIQKATQWTGEHFTNLGLDVEYHQWGGVNYPNVIAELPGLINPDKIFIIGGHLDNVPSTGLAPGADDNASGSVATLIAADILTQFDWGCTLRFALWTGEEQGLHGSAAYAQRSYNLGENIAGFLNLDMIAWNTPGSSPDIDLHAKSTLPETLVLAQLFADVIDAYDINLIPEIIPNGTGASDHASFWNYGYTAILGIEDTSDFNPRYHTANDKLEYLDLDYYTEFVKAAIGTFAHMTDCLIPSGLGSLEGAVTADNDGAPIEGARVSAESSDGYTYNAYADSDGYYARPLLEGEYTVTASAYGYLPSTASGVIVEDNAVTSLDFALLEAPYYAVSGTVMQAGSGFPLLAQIAFEGSPVITWSDPTTGFYSAELPEGEYTMHVSAALHQPETRSILLSEDRTEDFLLNTLPCVLLVDDDNNAPDVRPYYISALDFLGIDYDVFDVGGGAGNGPALDQMLGYSMVVWFSGDKYGSSAGPNGSDEANLANYLNSGGKLFLSSQDYLFDFGLTSFGQNYLGIGSFSNDSGNANTKYDVAGSPIGDGLGPCPLTYPVGFLDYGDMVNPGPGASVDFRSLAGGGNNLDISKDGGDWKTVFFGTSWVPVYNANAANGVELMGAIVDWFGGCGYYGVWLSGDDEQIGIPGETLTYTLTVTNASSGFVDSFDVSLEPSIFPTFVDIEVVGPLEAGASAEINVTVEIPETALPGEIDTVEVSATSQGDSGKWASAVLTTTVSGSYGVQLSSDETEASGPAGSAVTYPFTLSNTGSLIDTLVLTTLDVHPDWEVQLALDSFELAGGESVVSSLQVLIPEGAEPGDLDSFTLQAESGHNPSLYDAIEFTTAVSQVCNPPGNVDFQWSPGNPRVGDVMTFVATAAGTPPLSFSWDFGDGNSAEGQQVIYLYEEGGVYTVTLTVSNDCGQTSTQKVLTIAPVVMRLYLPFVMKGAQ
jgi:PKD repeat protein